ncbi:PREDICTED: 60S ribosomal protein L19-like [Nicrophorus vespilloides]|uniref:Large ribosomal subunit protein eL19 n=1 Tax=Nicrophorus vespilloides TaxID=110193 RepID=A0ABM1M1D2_NICVS|nr:PREDICTED: 60S ribosomal protein L19-like [Nicrophorus vespilloides]
MSNLRLQKRLAASIKGCGKRKIWMDPNECFAIAEANTRLGVRRLLNDGYIIMKPNAMHSKYRVRKTKRARQLGRHSGFGKRKGTANARTNTKRTWTVRTQILRRLLRKYRQAKKIDKHFHSQLYMKVKGNHFKNKRVLIEYIFKKKANMARTKLLADQAEARRTRAREARHRRMLRIAMRKKELASEDKKEEVVAVPEGGDTSAPEDMTNVTGRKKKNK